MRVWQVVGVWVRGVSFFSAAVVLAACTAPSGGGGGGGGGGGSDGGAGGPLGWHLANPQDVRTAGLVSYTFAEHTGGSSTTGAPPATDPWRQGELTDKSFDITGDDGDGHGDAHVAVAISGDTVTITGSANGSSGGTIVGGGDGNFSDMDWCYRPATAGSTVRFTVTMNVQALTVTGTNALAYAEFSNWTTNSCGPMKLIDMGTETDAPAGCTTDSIDLTADSGPNDDEACLFGDVDSPSLDWDATGGDGSNAGGGTASVSVVYTIKATSVP